MAAHTAAQVQDTTIVLWRTQGLTIALAALYLEPSAIAWSRNMDKLGGLGEFLRSLDMPFIIGGDFNCDPAELTKTGWPRRLKAEILHTTEPTCTSGRGRTIDFFLISHQLVHSVVSTELATDTPWRPHHSVVLKVQAQPVHVHIWTAPKPPKIESHYSPDWPWERH